MKKSELNIAIAGCGKVAHLHAKAILQTENVNLTAAWSRNKSSALKFAEQYGIKACSDISLMVKENNIDIVIVCTPHPFHRSPAISAANAGAHLLVEKPISSTLEDCDMMLDACKKNGVKIGVVSQRRWYEPVRRVKQAIDAGKLDQPVLGTINMLGWRDKDYYDSDEWRGTWEMEGGGVLVNQAPHQLDILLWYMGEIDEVFAVWKNLNHPYIEVEDTALAIIRFKSGALGNIIVSNSQKPGIYGKVHVHGKNGASAGVQTDGGAMFIAGKTGIAAPPENDIWSIPGEEDLLPGWKEEDAAFFASIDPTVYFMKCQIKDFRDAIFENRDPLVTGNFGRKTVELFTAIYRSQRDRIWIKFPLEPEKERDDMDGRKVDI
ncbi:MAG: Gfo/Idh/MocA family oxidoreductase [Bacteroidales bacterium]